MFQVLRYPKAGLGLKSSAITQPLIATMCPAVLGPLQVLRGKARPLRFVQVRAVALPLAKFQQI